MATGLILLSCKPGKGRHSTINKKGENKGIEKKKRKERVEKTFSFRLQPPF
jgi:hypothetical protein